MSESPSAAVREAWLLYRSACIEARAGERVDEVEPWAWERLQRTLERLLADEERRAA